MIKNLPNIATEFPEWYQEVIYRAELADLAPVRGCMVIRPYGFALWEQIKTSLDAKIKKTGHHNAYFPLFIPMSFLQKEAEHVEGFAPELAVVTHAGGQELEEPLVVRPTSETIIHYMFAQWIKSWRDLPMKINQWANVVRWEKRTRPFLRTTEFLWQEGHTAHETAQEAQEEAQLMLNEYLDIIRNYLAIPAVPGKKSESEKFAGADVTYTIEGLMPDGKALQMCTSHLISQNFAKSFGMTFQDRDSKLAYPFLTSWGFTTRSIGATVMVHGDDKGLVLPPKIAPIQVVIIPIYKKGTDNTILNAKVKEIAQELENKSIRVHCDLRDYETPGSKFYTWELKGVPVRIELGPRDLQAGQSIVVDRLGLGKNIVSYQELSNYVATLLITLQQEMFNRAQIKLTQAWYQAAKLIDFGPQLVTDGGFVQTGWCNEKTCETKLKEYSATIRCLLNEKKAVLCFACNQSSITDILVAKAY